MNYSYTGSIYKNLIAFASFNYFGISGYNFHPCGIAGCFYAQ